MGVYAPDLKMYRVIHERGKALSSGGFGVSIREAAAQEGAATMTTTMTYLFAEEALFLHEKGLVELVDDDGNTTLGTKELMGRLPEAGVSLPVYLVYAHLRSQTYRVIRHNSKRRSLLEEMQEYNNNNNNDDDDDSSKGKKKQRRWNQDLVALKQSLQQSAVQSPPPSMWDDNDDNDDNVVEIAWDVYQPDSGFRKSNPGLPSMYVTVRPFATPSPSFREIQRLLQQCAGIPLKIATVADGGTVVMFAVTDFGVPRIRTAEKRS